MKTKQAILSKLKSLLAVLILLLLIPSTKIFAGDTTTGKSIYVKKIMDEDGRKGKKGKSSKKNEASQVTVRIIPDIIKRAMHVVARSPEEKKMELFVFDVEGNMVANYKIKAGEKITISDLKRGEYMYHVFSNDEQLATGKLEFR